MRILIQLYSAKANRASTKHSAVQFYYKSQIKVKFHISPRNFQLTY
jgi:hypothetical protein